MKKGKIVKGLGTKAKYNWEEDIAPVNSKLMPKKTKVIRYNPKKGVLFE